MKSVNVVIPEVVGRWSLRIVRPNVDMLYVLTSVLFGIRAGNSDRRDAR